MHSIKMNGEQVTTESFQSHVLCAFGRPPSWRSFDHLPRTFLLSHLFSPHSPRPRQHNRTPPPPNSSRGIAAHRLDATTTRHRSSSSIGLPLASLLHPLTNTLSPCFHTHNTHTHTHTRVQQFPVADLLSLRKPASPKASLSFPPTLPTLPHPLTEHVAPSRF